MLSDIFVSIDSILGSLGGVFSWLRHWLDRPAILRGQQRNWWHVGGTGDGNPSMQIVTYWYVMHRTEWPVAILNAQF